MLTRPSSRYGLALVSSSRQPRCHSTPSDIVSRWVWVHGYRPWRCAWQSAIHGLTSQHCFQIVLVQRSITKDALRFRDGASIRTLLTGLLQWYINWNIWCSDETATVSVGYGIVRSSTPRPRCASPPQLLPVWVWQWVTCKTAVTVWKCIHGVAPAYNTRALCPSRWPCLHRLVASSYDGCRH